MAYIYIIKNDINNKKYIGKTEFSIEKRFKEHICDSQKPHTEKRPLYNAMKKYGVEHFFIEVLEQCSFENSSEREKYWINYYDTYTNGYNATTGGEGRPFVDYEKILNLYDSTYNTKQEIAEKCKCSIDSVTNVVEEYRDKPDWKERQRVKIGKPVRCIETNITFQTAGHAAEWLSKTKNMSKTSGASHISKVCQGIRKTCGGYHWEYV